MTVTTYPVQYTLPAALVIILVSIIGTENIAATWYEITSTFTRNAFGYLPRHLTNTLLRSSINRTISTTIWPLLLRADTIGARHRPMAAVVLS